MPVLIGVGISNPEQAREVVAVADGVVVGSSARPSAPRGCRPRRGGRVRGRAPGGDRPLSGESNRPTALQETRAAR